MLDDLLSRIPGYKRPLPRVCEFPPPYRSMLALNGDVEWTSWGVQVALYEEFAARDLEAAFSFWLFADPKVTWRLLEEDGTPGCQAAAANILGRAGLLDTLHSIGGRAHLGGCNYGRKDIHNAYDYLADQGWFPRVYTNHGGVYDRQNVAGAGWASYQEGDKPDSDLYHLDITVAHGVNFIWCDPDYTSEYMAYEPGVDVEASLFLSDTGRDGTPFLRFRRWLGKDLPYGPSLDNLHQQLESLLGDIKVGGYSVIYQHLGVERKEDGRPAPAKVPPLRQDAATVLNQLAAAQKNKDILVTTTSRLLIHAALMAARPWIMEWKGSVLHVKLEHSMLLGDCRIELTPDDFQGWAIEVPGGSDVAATFAGQPITMQRFEHEGISYAGFIWRSIDVGSAVEKARAAVVERTKASLT